MPKRTQLTRVLPWTGGLETSTQESLIRPDQLVIADNVIFGASQVKLKRDGINFNFDDATDGSDNIISINDFYFDSGLVKDSFLISADDAGNIFQYAKDTGARTDLTADPEIFTVLEANTGSTYDVSAPGLHFFCSAPGTDYYVWHNVTDGANTQTDPAIALRTGIQVDILLADTAIGISTKRAAAIDLEADFGSVSGGTATVTTTNAANGAVTDAADVDTTTTIATTQQGTDAWTTPSKITQLTYNNLNLLAATGAGNNIKFWDGLASAAVELSDHPLYTAGDPDPPEATLLQEHIGRVWTNDKNNKDRLHFSETFNPLKWQGFGDSGAIDIGIGDGDPEGITAIFPTFRNTLFVAKKTKLYRIDGLSPETFQIKLVSNSIGCETHNSVIAVDQNEVYWLSARGIHSLSTTSTFGDFDVTFVSKDIQTTFNDDFQITALGAVHGTYLPQINSIAFAVQLDTKSENNDIYLYNIPNTAWYRWPNVSCTALVTSTDADRQRFYLGTNTGRVAQTFTGALNDTTSTGGTASIVLTLKTGVIHVDDNRYTVKGFKKLITVFKPSTSSTLTVTAKIDNFPIQAISYSNINDGEQLGINLVLGTSALGFSQVLAPFAEPIAGFGRGIQLEFCQSGTDEATEIQGFMIEWEPAGDSQEVLSE